jgi:pyruvate,orthophosphate dikinase
MTAVSSTPSTSKYVYVFGTSRTEGAASMKNLLGGKGANLAEMCRLGIPVPSGFTISTEACTIYTEQGKAAALTLIEAEVKAGVAYVEQEMGRSFGNAADPLLLSVRSGARASMPGMMDTILNLGLNDEAVEGLAARSGNPRFAWDSYRRFVQMYGDVVMGLKPVSKEEHDPFEVLIDMMKEKKGVELDTDLDAEDLKELVARFKALIRARIGRDFPTDPWEQLWGSVAAVFESWNNERARIYRELNDIPVSWGTAVNVQAMVFGNLGSSSATGVAFTRDAGTGEDLFNGEFLVNAQGEDVVAGIRTPQQISRIGSRRWAELARVSEAERLAKYPSLEELMPSLYEELIKCEHTLENHFRDMQDLEFTIQEGKLWMLQTRNGKRTGAAMVRIAMEMLQQGMIDEKTALGRVTPERLNELLHPIFDNKSRRDARIIARGLPASPGAASGQIVFFADEAEEWAKAGKSVILVRHETSPEDIGGMHAARGILTARGGMTSHAAVVARGMGKCCVAGCEKIEIDYATKTLKAGDVVLRQGDWLSLNGSTGEVIARPESPTSRRRSCRTSSAHVDANGRTRDKRMKVRANADTPTRPSGAQVRRRRHRTLPHRAHVLRGRPHRRGARDDPRRRRGRRKQGARQAAADAARATSKGLQGDEGHPGHHPHCSTRRCTSSCRTTTNQADRRDGQGHEGLRSTEEEGARGSNCTSSTRCSATAAAGSASRIPRSPRCRRAPSSRRRRRRRKGTEGVVPEIMIPLVGPCASSRTCSG